MAGRTCIAAKLGHLNGGSSSPSGASCKRSSATVGGPGLWRSLMGASVCPRLRHQRNYVLRMAGPGGTSNHTPSPPLPAQWAPPHTFSTTSGSPSHASWWWQCLSTSGSTQVHVTVHQITIPLKLCHEMMVCVHLKRYAQVISLFPCMRCCLDAVLTHDLVLPSPPLPSHAVIYHGMPAIDENGVMHDSFRLTSFAMSLLLAFRLNRSYERWKDARSSLSGVVRDPAG